MFGPSHSFKYFISCLHVTILSCVMLMNHEYILISSVFNYSLVLQKMEIVIRTALKTTDLVRYSFLNNSSAPVLS